MTKKIIVVGDKFSEFSNGRDIITISQLDLITQIPANIIDTASQFIVGQGVREDYAGKVLDNQERNKHHENKLDLTELQQLATTGKNVHSHKELYHNILIGTAGRVSEDLYVMPLSIDERCELMADHQTGKHIQGMILVEASRQAFIAITDEFYMADNTVSTYYVINEMNMKFDNFLFPLPALIYYELLEKDINERRSRFKAIVRISQHTTLCSSMDVSFTVYPSVVISEREEILATGMTHSVLQSKIDPSMAIKGSTHV
ncbi:AfsA-related hotdog domain-containing protein [Sodalis sp. RH22]|uniref:AfsA-related hotdog domain-containing protein n=1 Tax=unclassified Sodalis (in: enterobacteria) TaxID=2636512 RepID=UPI0039B647AF